MNGLYRPFRVVYDGYVEQEMTASARGAYVGVFLSGREYIVLIPHLNAKYNQFLKK